MKRHIGKLNTGAGCIVVWLQIPNAEDHALVVQVDTLPDRIEAAVMEIVESPEGQADPTLANVLNRRQMPDMGNITVLQALHNMGLLLKVSVDDVIMYPQPNMPFPLRTLLAQMGRTVPDNLQSSPEIKNAEEVRYNPYDTAQIEATEEGRGKARLKIFEAELLEEEARKKREEAYRYDPSLRPTSVRTKATTEAKVEAAAVVSGGETKTVAVKPRKPAAKKAAKKASA